MNQITNENGKLLVPDKIIIPFIEGDGVGEEILTVCRDVVNAAVYKEYGNRKSIEWLEVLAGTKAFESIGEWLPQATVQAFKEYVVGLKGPLILPEGKPDNIDTSLHKALDLYACIRPIKYIKGVCSPLKAPNKINMYIFRENTEDAYANLEWEPGSKRARQLLRFLTDEMEINDIRYPETSAFGIKAVSSQDSEKLVRAAIRFAVKHSLPTVTLVHKGNTMKYTEGGFKQWGYHIADSEFPEKTFSMYVYETLKKVWGPEVAEEELKKALISHKVLVQDVTANFFFQDACLHPERYSVIATLNLNGEFISDQLIALVGGINILPQSHQNEETGRAIFEPVHPTLAHLAGKNVANPSSMILAGAMLLGYIGWNKAATQIVEALRYCFTHKKVTKDMAAAMPGISPLSTRHFRDEVIQHILKG